MAPLSQLLSAVPEADELFQAALDHHLGRNGRLRDSEKATSLYTQAALQLERICAGSPEQVPECLQALAALVDFFMRAARIGALGSLPRTATSPGTLVVPMNRANAGPLPRGGNSLADMTRLGISCMNSGNLEGGKRWLHKALQAGHGDAAYYLALYYYNVDKDVRNMLISLKEGAKRNSERCSRYLCTIYELGLFGQRRNPKLAKHYAGKAASGRAPLPAEDETGTRDALGYTAGGRKKKEKKDGAAKSFTELHPEGDDGGQNRTPRTSTGQKDVFPNGVVTWLR